MRNLSNKELSYINDTLSWELLSAKKCFQYAHQENNSQYAKVFFDAAHAHQQNYISLLDYVQQFNTERGGQIH